MKKLDEKAMSYLETHIPEPAEGVRGSRFKEKDCFFVYKQYICL